ncbi:MAG: ParB N-terminal domain-containing protein [Planctomycetota bacterium]
MSAESERLRVEWVEIGQVFCSPSNPRLNDQAVEPVSASLRRFGFQQPIVAKPSGEVIAAHTRLEAAIAKRRPMPSRTTAPTGAMITAPAASLSNPASTAPVRPPHQRQEVAPRVGLEPTT